jgi:hypothetical protein
VTVDAALCERVTGLLAEYLDEAGEADPDEVCAPGEGDADLDRSLDPLTAPVAIRSGTALVLVRLVDADPPLVRVFSPLLREIERSPELLVELNEINAHLSFLRLFWRAGTVFAATELLATSLDRDALANACDALCDLADYYDERLHSRYGGELAYGS